MFDEQFFHLLNVNVWHVFDVSYTTIGYYNTHTKTNIKHTSSMNSTSSTGSIITATTRTETTENNNENNISMALLAFSLSRFRW